MTNRKWILGYGIGVCAAGAAIGGCGWARAQQAAAPADREVELTVYKDDFAMVSERRPVELAAGRSKIELDDISKQLDPDSVLLDWPNAKSHPDVVTTTYNLGVSSGSSLISRLNGQPVELMWPSNDGKPGETVSGRLEAAQTGSDFALRTPDKLYVNPTGMIIAPANTALTLPQLSVELNDPEASRTQLGLSYLTRGMSWSADYVAKLNADSSTAEVECWATVTNKTGIPFPLAKLTLMAGSPNRTVSAPQNAMGTVYSNGSLAADVTLSRGRSLDGVAVAGNVAREIVGDLYAYKIPLPATIGMDQMNRVSVLGTRTVPVTRTYSIRIPTLSSWGYADDGWTNRSIPHASATVSLDFTNDAASHLGIPLPSGQVRVYERGSAGQEQYTGADQIADTPKDERVHLTLSNAFDVYGSYRVVKSEHPSKHIVRKTVEATIVNEKKSPLMVRLVQDYGSRWTCVDESLKSEKLDANTVLWKVPVRAGDRTVLKYVVDLKD